MRASTAARAKRLEAGILGGLLLILVLFSAFYIAAEADHDCCGEDCPICACIRQCEHTLHGAGAKAAAHGFVLLPVLIVLLAAGPFPAAFPQETPVSGKVRLNN